jgi:hypothetical protein
MSYHFLLSHIFHTSILHIFDVRDEIQFSIVDLTQEFAFCDNRYGNFIYFQFRVRMQGVLLAELHAGGSCFRELKSIFTSPFLDFIETQLK